MNTMAEQYKNNPDSVSSDHYWQMSQDVEYSDFSPETGVKFTNEQVWNYIDFSDGSFYVPDWDIAYAGTDEDYKVAMEKFAKQEFKNALAAYQVNLSDNQDPSPRRSDIDNSPEI